MKYEILFNKGNIEGTIKLPSSKSISNRLLVINALSGKSFQIKNLSESDDTIVLKKAIDSEFDLIDIGHAGTAMRFATAYFSNLETTKIITGSDRMKQRPIGNLVNCLRSIGAEIDYIENEGCPPLKIKGKKLDGGIVSIDSSVSSQFISALLMVAPYFKNGLEIYLENEVISSSYIQLTIEIMKYMGVETIQNKRSLKVIPQHYIGKDITVEGDWSGASYWFELVALSIDAKIEIQTLYQNSLQGDSKVSLIFEKLGVKTHYSDQSIMISKSGQPVEYFEFDFIENPDLVQTVAVTCVFLNIPFKFHGTQSLRIKETDRIAALQIELGKFGAHLVYHEPGILQWNGEKNSIDSSNIIIDTYHDHRMALAFAPIAVYTKSILINDPLVVTKSYPGYWKDLLKLGFTYTTIV